jgi:hypothetical protein
LVLIALGLGAAGIFVCLYIGLALSSRRTVAHLRITRTPPGEAPEEIRQTWVGVELPLRRQEMNPSLYPTVGVLSGRSPCERASECGFGYGVDGRAAVKALASHSPEAAAWWRQHAPHVLEPGYRLWFPAEICERLGGASVYESLRIRGIRIRGAGT